MHPYFSVKCLTIHQPYAWLIVAGLKPVENRTWGTSYRGPLLIHAGKRVLEDDVEYYDALYFFPADMPRGALVGIAQLVDCTREQRSKWHNDGCYGWYLENVVQFEEPIPLRGRQGLFDVKRPDPIPEWWPTFEGRQKR